MGATYNYNSRQITLKIGSHLIEGGFDDGEFLRIEQEADDISKVVGTSGDVAISVINDDSAIATIKLLAGADSNDVLSALRTAGRATPSGIAAVPFFVADRLGRGIWEAPVAVLLKPPVVAFDRKMGAREWAFFIAHLRRTDGGNVRLS